MKTRQLRELYDTLLDTGELFELLPDATGIWDKDKKMFKAIQDQLEESLEG